MMIEINGEDGGGQVLRSALSLSMITGQAFRMVNIRGLRSKPGLMRQHLTCVKAALEVCGGAASGDALHSTELVFKPGVVRSGDYVFKIGSAGSSTLLFQTLLPALMLADGVSRLELHGGTHNPMAPSADFIERAFLPQIRKMGVGVSFECVRYGFAPSGGGCISAEIHPVESLEGFSLLERGDVVAQEVECVLANVRKDVGERELAKVRSLLDWDDDCFQVRVLDDVDGSGNVLFVEEVYEHAVIHVTSLGRFGKSAGRVAGDAVKTYQTFLKSGAVVGSRLADQLLLPMALAGGCEMRSLGVTNHVRTNLNVIEQFLDVSSSVRGEQSGATLISV